MTTPIVIAENLHKTYRMGRVDVPVLQGASLSVNKGEWVAILGASGSGKSTLLHLLGDLDRPDPGRGSLSFHGRSLEKLNQRARNKYRNQSVGFIFQFYHLLPELDVLRNAAIPSMVQTPLFQLLAFMAAQLLAMVAGCVAFGTLVVALCLVGARIVAFFEAVDYKSVSFIAGLIGGIVGILIASLYSYEIFERINPRLRQRIDRAKSILTSFGLGHRLKHRPRELSGGERQRVAIARALMNDPEVLLADEPTGNLDEETGREILDLIAEQHRKGLTIVMVTHDINVAQRADRIVRLHHGRVET